jgi:LPPG:FO 2-phospho-L-lactate transferase
MSDDAVRTRVLTPEGWLDFQEYFVHRQCQPVVLAFEFAGADAARAQPQVLAALKRKDLRAVILCPSNPFVSIEPILAVPGIRTALKERRAPVIAVTPIIGGKAIKGPAAKMMSELGLEVSGAAVARRYAGLIDGFIVDESDAPPEPLAPMQFFRAPTLMINDSDRVLLAQAALQAADGLKSAGPGVQ